MRTSRASRDARRIRHALIQAHKAMAARREQWLTSRDGLNGATRIALQRDPWIVGFDSAMQRLESVIRDLPA